MIVKIFKCLVLFSDRVKLKGDADGGIFGWRFLVSKVRYALPKELASSVAGDGEDKLDDVEGGEVKEEDADGRVEQLTEKTGRHTFHLKSNKKINHTKNYHIFQHKRKEK